MARAAGRGQGLGQAGGCLSASPARFHFTHSAEGVGALGGRPKGRWLKESAREGAPTVTIEEKTGWHQVVGG